MKLPDVFTPGLGLLAICVAAASCSQPAETTETAAGEPAAAVEAPPFTPTTLVDSVAAAHGYANWADVEELNFNFRVAQGGEVAAERTWKWFPRTDSVVLTAAGEALGYTRNTELDSAATAADGNFINDSYWLLMPFYLEWSKDGYTTEVERGATMPLSGEPATKLTVLYTGDGGYTPGDAYDLYVDADYLLREWVFRKDNAEEATMSMTWEGYAVLDGMHLPGTHKAGPELPLEISHPGTSLVLVGE